MARLLDDALSEYLEVDSAAITALPFSVSCWFNTDIATANETLFWIGDKDATNTYSVLVADGAAVGDPISAFSRDATTTSGARATSAFSTNTWQHAAGVWTSTTSRAAYLSGGNKGTDTTSVTEPPEDRMSIGRHGDSTPSTYWSGSIAELGVWDVALTDGEIAILGLGFSPLFVRPTSLVLYVPIIGRSSPEIDRVGALNFTLTGTTNSAHPRIIYPSSSQMRRFTTAVAEAAAAQGAWKSLLGVGL